MAKQKLGRDEMMLKGNLAKIIPEMALPTIISFIISSIYNLADTYFVSSIGTNATAAVSVNSSLDHLIMMVGSMFAVGATSYASRLLGAGDKKTANETVSTAFIMAAAFGLLVLALGEIFMHPLVRLLGATPTCEQYSVDYATYVLLAAPFMSCSFVMNQCLRGEGNALYSMFGMGFGGILNCFLDPIFIFRMGLGVAGASMATAISKLVSFGILIAPYLRKKTIITLSVKYFRPIKKTMTEIISMGSSALFRNLFNVVSAIILNNLAGRISDSVLAGIGVCNKVMMFPFGIILGYGMGFQPVAGYNWGAKDYKRVREGYRFANRSGVGLAVVMAGLIAIFAKPLIGVFTETDAEMMRIGALAIRLQCLAMPVHCWVMIVNMLANGLGKAKEAFLLATSRQGTCFLPVVFPMALIFGAIGVASAQAVADVVSLALAIPLRRKILRMIDETERKALTAAGV